MPNTCPKCGYKLKETNLYCPQCGERIVVSTKADKKEPEVQVGEIRTERTAEKTERSAFIKAIALHAGVLALLLIISQISESAFFIITIVAAIITLLVVAAFYSKGENNVQDYLSVEAAGIQGLFLIFPYLSMPDPAAVTETLVLVMISFTASVVSYIIGMTLCSRRIPANTDSNKRFGILVLQGLLGMAVGTGLAMILAIFIALCSHYSTKKRR